jgi:hypothetical protein
MSIKIRKEDAKYMYALVERIVNQGGPGMSCNLQEREGATILRQDLDLSCDEVVIEKFTCHPRACLGWIKVISIMMPISILLSMLLQFVLNLIIIIILSLLSFLLSFLSLLIMWEEYFNYNEFIDFLFHKKPSQNVIGRFKSESERKKIIIISSYIDSALEFKFYKFLG